VRSHVVARPVARYDLRSDYARLVERLRLLSGARLRAAEIAEKLNAEGFRPPRRADRFSATIVLKLAARLGIPRREPYGTQRGLGPDEFRPMGLSRLLGVPRDTMQAWLRARWLNVRRDEDGHAIIWADAGELNRLRKLRRLLQAGVKGARLAELKKPRPRPTG
jgi:hypothetical protein